jgi:Domain of unknown function (DUF5071)
MGSPTWCRKTSTNYEAIEGLRKLSPEELAPLLPELLEWVADVPEQVAEPIRKILQTADE